jgi:hypothetical protein
MPALSISLTHVPSPSPSCRLSTFVVHEKPVLDATLGNDGTRDYLLSLDIKPVPLREFFMPAGHAYAVNFDEKTFDRLVQNTHTKRWETMMGV